MRSVVVLGVLAVAVGCGARTGLDDGDGGASSSRRDGAVDRRDGGRRERDAGGVRRDGSMPPRRDAGPPPDAGRPIGVLSRMPDVAVSAREILVVYVDDASRDFDDVIYAQRFDHDGDAIGARVLLTHRDGADTGPPRVDVHGDDWIVAYGRDYDVVEIELEGGSFLPRSERIIVRDTCGGVALTESHGAEVIHVLGDGLEGNPVIVATTPDGSDVVRRTDLSFPTECQFAVGSDGATLGFAVFTRRGELGFARMGIDGTTIVPLRLITLPPTAEVNVDYVAFDGEAWILGWLEDFSSRRFVRVDGDGRLLEVLMATGDRVPLWPTRAGHLATMDRLCPSGDCAHLLEWNLAADTFSDPVQISDYTMSGSAPMRGKPIPMTQWMAVVSTGGTPDIPDIEESEEVWFAIANTRAVLREARRISPYSFEEE